MASSYSAGSSRAAISKREQIFVRYAVVHEKRMNHKVTKKVILQAIVAAIMVMSLALQIRSITKQD